MPKNIRLLSVAFLVLPLLVGGCPQRGGVIVCPTFEQYSDDFLDKAIAELEAINRSAQFPHVEQMINDYGVQRSAIKKCIQRKKERTKAG